MTQLKFESFSIYSLMLIDQIQTRIAHDILLLCVHVYGIRLVMKPILVGENFIIFKILSGGSIILGSSVPVCILDTTVKW